VVESTGLQYSVENRVLIHQTRVRTSLRAYPDDMPTVNRLLIQKGRYLDASHPEILANEDFNFYYKLSIGDTVGITGADGQEAHLPVIGLAYNPMWDTYRSVQPPYLYLSEKTLRELFPDEADWSWSVGLRLADPEAVEDVLNKIEANLRPHAVDNHSDWRDVRTSAIFEAQLNFAFLSAFSIFAILATIFVISSSVSAIVLSQFRQIGILKAIGFTQNQILILYLGQYLLLSLIGTLLGLVLGIVLSPLPLQSIVVSLNSTFRPPVNLPLIIMVFIFVPAIVMISVLGTAYRAAKVNIIKTIATGAEAPEKKLSWGTQLGELLGLPMILSMGINDVFVRPIRSMLTGFNLMLGVMGIVFGLTLNQTLDAFVEDPALLGIVYDGVVTRELTTDSRTQHLLQTTPGIEAFYAERLIDAKTPADKSFQVRAVAGEVSAFPDRISDGRLFEPNTYEAVAGQGLLDWLGLEIGDELTLILDDNENRPVTWRIVGQYNEPSNAGQMLMVNLSTVERAAKQAKPTTYYLKLAPNIDTTRLKQHLVAQRDADLTVTLVDEGIPWSIFYLQVGIFALAAILIGIALINVFNTSLLTVQEKLKTIGVLKTVGMTPGQVVGMVNTTAGFLGLLATLIGIPLGLIFTKAILTLLSQNYGISEVNLSLNIFYVLLLIPLMIGISMLGSFIPGRQAARLPIVQVLRNE
jgi:putative ABC transport system permease protein